MTTVDDVSGPGRLAESGEGISAEELRLAAQPRPAAGRAAVRAAGDDPGAVPARRAGHRRVGRTQPVEQPWNRGGFANNLVQRVEVVVVPARG